MLSIILPPELERALSEQARAQGTTPELLALDSLRERFASPDGADAVLARYARRELTHGEAAALLGLSRAALLEELASHNLSAFQYDAAEVLSEAGL